MHMHLLQEYKLVLKFRESEPHTLASILSSPKVVTEGGAVELVVFTVIANVGAAVLESLSTPKALQSRSPLQPVISLPMGGVLLDP